MVFEEHLINEVRAHPIVWNKWSEDYKNRLKNEKEWAIIAKNLNKRTNEVKTRWRNLRDVYQKEIKKFRKPRSGDPGNQTESNYQGKWTCFHHMTFLKDVMVPRPTHSNYEPNNDESRDEQSTNDWEFEIDNYRSDQFVNSLSDNDDTIQKRDLISQRASASSSDSRSQENKRKQKKSACSEFGTKMLQIEKEKIKAFQEKNNKIDDEDMLFLKSLAPNFRYLNAVQKLRLKSKIQNLIADEIAETLAAPSSSPYSAHSISMLPSPVHASNSSTYMSPPPSETRQFYETFNDDV